MPNRPRLDAYLEALRQEGVAVAGVIGRDPKHAAVGPGAFGSRVKLVTWPDRVA